MSFVKDIDQTQFGTAVLQRSAEVPVVVDFWASWCGPCKVLGPILERLADSYQGRFELVKVDVDANPQLQAQFRVQSIPTVIAFKDGRPVSSFLGAKPEAQVRTWIDALLPTAMDLMVERARDLALEGDEPGAETLYRQVLDEVPDHPEAATALAALLIARRETDDALVVLGKLPRTAEVERLEAAARLTARSEVDLSALEARLTVDPADDAARIELGEALAAKGEHEAGLDHLLTVVRNAGPLRDKARRAIVDVLGLLGPEHPLTAVYRRRLASELF
ncbi:MAG TPA: thioredoxin [Acidimicrobiia bacterium]|nr:thioredoxin [Acidimicrobiia bacterium]